MNPATIAAIAQGVSALIEIWRNHADKPAGWVPTQQDWNDLLALDDKSAEEFKKEAAARLGVPWPPVK